MQKEILVSGASGLVGSAFFSSLDPQTHRVLQLVRHPVHADSSHVSWSPTEGEIEREKLEGLTAVVHLAGEPIAAKRWSPEQKARIRDSRVNGTRLLAESLAAAKNKPEVLVCASAIGWYGDRGTETLTEASEAGDGFLTEVTQAWEKAADPAREAGIRVVHLRLGVVLSPDGGALAKMMLPFKLCLGGPLGDGQGFMSWVALPDVVAIFNEAVTNPDMKGAYNVTAPHPVNSREFAKALGKALGRPAVIPLPAPVIRFGLGEMGETLLLHSAKILPERLTKEVGYEFQYPELSSALEALL
ncbi:MAG: TIGR01777 family oxidoreductase [Verrucomicrobia bacterium]|nr:TIGR01777 family oxidoreductase [Verrucomicrobiota bacterium]MCH8510788.1 TIGR01777 family oxidoreductase [Kiritimatiellia bacterium]